VLLPQIDRALSGFAGEFNFADGILIKRKAMQKECFDGFAVSPGSLALDGGLITLKGAMPKRTK
jgi:hypothetical protein